MNLKHFPLIERQKSILDTYHKQLALKLELIGTILRRVRG